jgi:SAM-dependent methyltransferase
MDDATEVSSARDYYRRILPFYEKESLARSHLDFWRRLAREIRPRRILEIGAGLGRITAALARVAPASGIDVSLEMLAEARRRGGGSPVRFLAADARRVVFSCAFDLIVAPGDPLSHMTVLEDRRRTLRAVARQLSADGTFVMDGLYRHRQEIVSRKRRIRHADGVLSIEEAWIPIGSDDLWHARYRYRDDRRDGSVRKAGAAFRARAWDPATIESTFASCGLEIVDLWGGFDRSPFRRGSHRLIAVARPLRPRATAGRSRAKPGPRYRGAKSATGPSREPSPSATSPGHRSARRRSTC